MLKQIFKDDLNRLTIKRAQIYRNSCYIFFTDETFLKITANIDEEEYINLSFGERASLSWDFEELRGVGVISEEEYNEIKDKRDKEEKENETIREKRELERLKKKYEGIVK